MKIHKTITLIRHGATDYNDRDLMQGRIDLPLSDKGISQAQSLRDALSGKVFDIIYHSPLKRAFQTATIINENHQLDCIPVDCFKEIDIGEWEGQKFSAAYTKYKDIYKKWIVDSTTRIPGGESYADVQNRVKEGVIEVLNSEYKNILIFGHAAANRSILGNLLNMSPDLSRKFRLNNCGYATFIVYENKIKTSDNILEDAHVVLENWNQSSHLETLNNNK